MKNTDSGVLKVKKSMESNKENLKRQIESIQNDNNNQKNTLNQMSSETLAKEHLKKGLNNHAKDYQMPNDWWHEYGGDIYVVEIEIGSPSFNSCYRDNHLILDTK